jgi:hypothetical protein
MTGETTGKVVPLVDGGRRAAGPGAQPPAAGAARRGRGRGWPSAAGVLPSPAGRRSLRPSGFRPGWHHRRPAVASPRPYGGPGPHRHQPPASAALFQGFPGHVRSDGGPRPPGRDWHVDPAPAVRRSRPARTETGCARPGGPAGTGSCGTIPANGRRGVSPCTAALGASCMSAAGSPSAHWACVSISTHEPLAARRAAAGRATAGA